MSTRAGSPVAAQDPPDPVTDNLNWRSASPGVYEDAYIQPSDSMDVTTAPLGPVENGRAYLGLSSLDSPMDIQHDSALVQSELEEEFRRDFGATPCTITGSTSRLLHVVAFSHLSRPRYTSPPIALDSAGPQVHHTSPPDKRDLSGSYIGDSSDVNFSSVSAEPLSSAFIRPVSPLPPSSPGLTNDHSSSDDVTITPFPLPSSPVPSSSPPNVFTSSPARHALCKSPPTSPAPEKPMAVLPLTGPTPLKRLRSPDAMTTPTGGHNAGQGEGTAKKRVKHFARCS